MKPISITEIVSMATEVLIITDTPAAKAGEELTHTAPMHVCAYTHEHALNEEEHTDKHELFH